MNAKEELDDWLSGPELRPNVAPFIGTAKHAFTDSTSPDADIALASNKSFPSLCEQQYPQLSPLSEVITNPQSATDPDALTPPDAGIAPGSLKPDFVGAPRKIHRCKTVQDAHSHVEQAVYDTLWSNGAPEPGHVTHKLVRIGGAQISREARVHRRNVGIILRRLIQKQSIEVLDSEVSALATARLYRVLHFNEILRRRRGMGLEWVVRRRGVEFVDPKTGAPIFNDDESQPVLHPITASVAVTASDPIAATAAPIATSPSQGDAVTSPRPDAATAPRLRNDLKEKEQEPTTTVPAETSQILQALNRYASVDDSAVRQLISTCRKNRPDATLVEITDFVHEKGSLVARNPSISNPTGFLLAVVPRCFEGAAFDHYRQRQAEVETLRREEEQRRRREEDQMREWMARETANAELTLGSPAITPQQRASAERLLRIARQGRG